MYSLFEKFYYIKIEGVREINILDFWLEGGIVGIEVWVLELRWLECVFIEWGVICNIRDGVDRSDFLKYVGWIEGYCI